MNTYAWTNTTIPGGKSFRAVAYGNGRYVAVGDSAVAMSADGVSWTLTQQSTAEPFSHYCDITFGGGLFLCIAQLPGNSGHSAFTSADGETWTKCTSYSGKLAGGVTHDGTRFLTADNKASVDGTVWETRGKGFPGEMIVDVCHGRGAAVAATLAWNSGIYVCRDTDDYWKKATLPEKPELPGADNRSFGFRSLHYQDGVFLLCAENVLLASRDGLNWEVVLEQPNYNFVAVAGEYGYFIATSKHYATDAPKMFVSEDGFHWKEDPAAQLFSTGVTAAERLLLLKWNGSAMEARRGLREASDTHHLHTAAQVEGLARVAYSGDYEDLHNVPKPYEPDGSTLISTPYTNWTDYPNSLKTGYSVSLKDAKAAKAGQYFGKKQDGTFGFSDTFTPPENEIYVQCDGDNDQLKLQAAISRVVDTSIPTVIYPVGQCVLNVSGSAQADTQVVLIDLKENMTLDGSFGKIVLDFTEPTVKNAEIMTVVQARKHAVMRNCRVTYRGQIAGYCRLFVDTLEGYATLENNVFTDMQTYTHGMSEYGTILLKGPGNRISHNKFHNITESFYGHPFIHNLYEPASIVGNLFTGTISGGELPWELIYGDALILENKFLNITETALDAFIQTGGVAQNNWFENITTSAAIIQLDIYGEASSNIIKQITRPHAFLQTGTIQASGGNIRIISNYIFRSQTCDVAAIDCGDDALIQGNVIHYLEKPESAGDTAEVIGIKVEGDNAVIQNNRIQYRDKTAVKCPVWVNGKNCFIKNNFTNYQSIGTIAGEGTVQSENITGTLA